MCVLYLIIIIFGEEWKGLEMIFVVCSWRFFECDFWKCNGNDYLYYGVMEKYDMGCIVIIFRFYIV